MFYIVAKISASQLQFTISDSRNHLATYHKLYECEFCEKTFSTYQQLEQHINDEHANKVVAVTSTTVESAKNDDGNQPGSSSTTAITKPSGSDTSETSTKAVNNKEQPADADVSQKLVEASTEDEDRVAEDNTLKKTRHGKAKCRKTSARHAEAMKYGEQNAFK